ncbi:hypothetical protein LS73_006780 [Helicobacter muridarum]|uniref:Periplasmic protein n=1 Tax=Helicobacter muridarum TaxID=216 RepID=A0A377PWQ0_9HELI|nr:hypothetical protein [Helicobacter muridarum]TLD99769.1 hypothetical protein LS73_006780 [Helicobacter muridarum]STQ86997.1 Putative periplasmic protein [Helicobacter muridarum]
MICRFGYFNILTFLLFSCNCLLLWGENYDLHTKIKEYIQPKTYQTNAKFIQKLFKNESAFYKNGNVDVIKILNNLKNNGLLALKLNKPSNIKISFRVNEKNRTDFEPSFIFLAYATSNLLTNMGYSYFYVTNAKKNNDVISVSYTLNSESQIDPTVIISNIQSRGYNVIDVSKDSELHWIYDIRLEQPKITNAQQIKDGEIELNQVSGKYWIIVDSAGILEIMLNNEEKWNPKILIFDNNMNLLNAIMQKEMKQKQVINTNSNILFLMITDNYNPARLSNGIKIIFNPK